MPTGIKKDIHLNAIVESMRQVEAGWMTLTVQQRCQNIANAVIQALTAEFVPAPNLQVGNFPGLNGQFDFNPWTLQVNTQMAVGNVRDTPDQRKARIAKLGDTLTHEARHCEQWFRMIRLVIMDRKKKGMKTTVRELRGVFGDQFSFQALNRALQATPLNPVEEGETRLWYKSVYGKGSSFRDINVYGRNLRRTGTQIGNQYQNTEFRRYQSGLAEEDDAHQIGFEIQRKFLQGSGVQAETFL